MDSDITWFRIDLPDVPFYLEPIYHFITFILYAAIITAISLTVFHAGMYVVMNVPIRWGFFFFGFSFGSVVWTVLNAALIYAITITLSRGLMSTWMFIFAAIAYSALMKWLFGTLFIGLDTLNYWLVPAVGAYIAGIIELASLFRGTLSTALTYRV